jgi:hypothetical protein
MNIKLTAAAVAAVLSMAALTGCGGTSGSSSSGDYCSDLKTASANLADLVKVQNLNQDTFNRLQDAVHNLAGEAPANVKGSWTLFDSQLTFLQNALNDAGLSMDDFGALAAGQTPSGVDAAKLLALTKKLNNFDTAGLNTASTKIQNEAKSDCHVDLSGLNN